MYVFTIFIPFLLQVSIYCDGRLKKKALPPPHASNKTRTSLYINEEIWLENSEFFENVNNAFFK